MLGCLRCNQVIWRLWVQHRWKGVWICALLRFLLNPWWPWECILKAANLGQILWFIFGRNRNPRRLSYLLKTHSHLAVQQRLQASCCNSPPCAIIFDETCKFHDNGFPCNSEKKKTLKTQRCFYTMWPKSVCIQISQQAALYFRDKLSGSTITQNFIEGLIWLREKLWILKRIGSLLPLAGCEAKALLPKEDTSYYGLDAIPGHTWHLISIPYRLPQSTSSTTSLHEQA